MLLIDNSGSMDKRGDPPSDPKDYRITAALAFIDLLDDFDNLGVVLFGDRNHVIGQFSRIGGADARRALKQELDKWPTATDENTNMVDALREAGMELSQSQGDSPKFIVMLTDGQPEGIGDKNRASQMTEINTQIIPEFAGKIKLLSIALGPGADYEWLKSLADQTGAPYPQRVTRADDLPKAFLNTLKSIKALNLLSVSQGDIPVIDATSRFSVLAVKPPKTQGGITLKTPKNAVSFTSTVETQGQQHGPNYVVHTVARPAPGIWKVEQTGQVAGAAWVVEKVDLQLILQEPSSNVVLEEGQDLRAKLGVYDRQGRPLISSVLAKTRVTAELLTEDGKPLAGRDGRAQPVDLAAEKKGSNIFTSTLATASLPPGSYIARFGLWYDSPGRVDPIREAFSYVKVEPKHAVLDWRPSPANTYDPVNFTVKRTGTSAGAGAGSPPSLLLSLPDGREVFLTDAAPGADRSYSIVYQDQGPSGKPAGRYQASVVVDGYRDRPVVLDVKPVEVRTTTSKWVVVWPYKLASKGSPLRAVVPVAARNYPDVGKIQFQTMVSGSKASSLPANLVLVDSATGSKAETGHLIAQFTPAPQARPSFFFSRRYRATLAITPPPGVRALAVKDQQVERLELPVVLVFNSWLADQREVWVALGIALLALLVASVARWLAIPKIRGRLMPVAAPRSSPANLSSGPAAVSPWDIVPAIIGTSPPAPVPAVEAAPPGPALITIAGANVSGTGTTAPVVELSRRHTESPVRAWKSLLLHPNWVTLGGDARKADLLLKGLAPQALRLAHAKGTGGRSTIRLTRLDGTVDLSVRGVRLQQADIYDGDTFGLACGGTVYQFRYHNPSLRNRNQRR